MVLLIKLFLAHFIGDFVLQPKAWVDQKTHDKAKSPKLYIHFFIHGALIMLVLWNLDYWPLALTLMTIHGAIDITKLYAQNKKNSTQWFFIDQMLHFASIFFVWYVWSAAEVNLQEFIFNPQILIYATALVFITSASAIGLQVLMAGWSKSLKIGNEVSLRNAEKYIGILERLFVFMFVILGNWAAIGLLMVAKAIFYFADLKAANDKKYTEYILIGTLLSFGIAIAVALLVIALISLR